VKYILAEITVGRRLCHGRSRYRL